VITGLRSNGIRHSVEAFECGAIVNPGNLKNQAEGVTFQGLGGALFEAIDFADGRILNARFARCRVPRFSDVPPIDRVLVNRKDLPSVGAEEAPIVGIAPAVGTRLRELPILPKGRL
jgi:isoquinoline 1-oxidoreductase